MPLFRRIGRRIVLTDAGHDLQATALAALEEVRHGVRRLNAYSKPDSVIVSMSPGLALCWFMPRLPGLRADLPGIDPWLNISTEAEVPEEREIDIVLSERAWHDPGTVSVPLPGDRVWPLAAPALAAALVAGVCLAAETLAADLVARGRAGAGVRWRARGTERRVRRETARRARPVRRSSVWHRSVCGEP